MSGLLERAHTVRQSNVWIYTTMMLSACVSLLASFVLSVDAIELAKNPAANLGLMAEPVVITIAVASLAKVRFPRGFMLAAQVIYTLGLIFAYWLFYQAMFVIGALCPWCLLVTLSTTLVFASLTHVN